MLEKLLKDLIYVITLRWISAYLMADEDLLNKFAHLLSHAFQGMAEYSQQVRNKSDNGKSSTSDNSTFPLHLPAFISIFQI